MKHIYALQKTDGVCDIDQILSVIREVPGVLSATLLEGSSRVAITSDVEIPLELLNDTLAASVPCRLVNGGIDSE